mmetsp:Transcript_1705/g.10511  ORF Transcript_1705/g.10511 Transcript_1705/m.10511 type:complete len:226 (+) Transcript_1705:1772-2449(+)
MHPEPAKLSRMLASTELTSPTKPMSGLVTCLARMSFPSFPQSPTAFPPALLIRETMDLFTLPTRTISTTSMVAPSVTRSPFLKLGSIPTRDNHVLISGPPPCTNTTRNPTSASSTTSEMTPAFSVGSFMAAPPYLTTTVFPANFCKYGSASERIDTRSNSDTRFSVSATARTCVVVRPAHPRWLVPLPRLLLQVFGARCDVPKHAFMVRLWRLQRLARDRVLEIT